MHNQNHSTIDFFGLSVEQIEIISYLRKNLHLKKLCEKVLYQKIVRQVARERGLIVTDGEIQAEKNRWYSEKHLQTEWDIIIWLTEEMLILEEWEEAIGDRLLFQKLSESLFNQEVETYFIQHQQDFDKILLYQLIVPYQELAQELFYQIAEREISFYEAAHLYDIDEERRERCGCEGKIYRKNVNPELAEVLFDANIGEVISPVTTTQGIHLLLIEELMPSQLTATVRQDILERIFMQWLESQLAHLR
ncbi:MAG: peptidylprolyl isomerase [Scytonema sp. PMC 1069.18]|nr:peptidylprolyl isomerase [Scytonema sp. PMC 1069.18]MEC4882910.1 peptidylprolyl isomerase [Scytonema sp. PMC 1070.18]